MLSQYFIQHGIISMKINYCYNGKPNRFTGRLSQYNHTEKNKNKTKTKKQN